MKRLVAVISSLLVLPAFAEIAPQYYEDEVIEYVDGDVTEYVDEAADNAADTTEDAATPKQPSVAAARAGASGRVSASRAVATRQTSARNRTTTGASRALTARATTAANTATRTTATRTAPSRTVNTGATAARASIVQTDTVNAPLYTGRVGVRGSSSISARIPTVRITTNNNSVSTDTESKVESTDELTELAEMTDFCKAQYTACMDNFCNVLDDNQGRCSCSVNLKNYAKTEAALKQASEDLQDVAQRIQYIGLSAAEVETLFTQTAAELEMQSSNDSSQIKTDLDKIKDLIIDVKTAETSSDSGISLDLSGLLDFSIDSTGFDLSSFLGGGNADSITNQRGEQLYKTATARCKASVLNACRNQGVDTNIVTNAYDLEIDKQCLLYERSLTEANDNMSSTVRNAKSVLQKARLLVAQQKNAYDMRGCINALDACMQDEFVCGSDYENCLDPSGKYIVNGEVVIGSEPGKSGDTQTGALYTEAWATAGDDTNTNTNAWGGNNSLSSYITSTVTNADPASSSASMSGFLQYKIGYHDDEKDRDYGMCMSVLNKCQNITYDGRGQDAKYNPANNVIKEYLQRTMVQIKAKQDTVLADFAEDCIRDSIQCLTQNNWDSDKNHLTSDNTKPCEGTSGEGCTISNGNKVAMNACLPLITTCASVNGITGPASTQSLTVDEWAVAITK